MQSKILASQLTNSLRTGKSIGITTSNGQDKENPYAAEPQTPLTRATDTVSEQTTHKPILCQYDSRHTIWTIKPARDESEIRIRTSISPAEGYDFSLMRMRNPEIDLRESWICDIYKGTIHPTNEDYGDLVKSVKTQLIPNHHCHLHHLFKDPMLNPSITNHLAIHCNLHKIETSD